ncbi:hypothetical protein K505DRAFT_336634 [Melanomma pulvis-pyrius CBS 109.77]|uniref:Uncharacterized protein n=1 Tax=Melanomma pulvis-pyrius CBS 109.77 TaxID=1314802 RepID=A0A6A6XES5_9PLEO|nr:hypothetical protein K505DRAFT_336634 [Melanomma pulvis-pyrius CBS 109.77]
MNHLAAPGYLDALLPGPGFKECAKHIPLVLKTPYTTSLPATSRLVPPTFLPMPQQTLGAHIASAAISREKLENSIALSKAAVYIMLEALQRAETSLQTLSEIRIRTEALATKAENKNTTTAELRRELADWTFKSMDSYKEHEGAIEDAWKGWRSAMAGIVKAGQSRKAHEEIMASLQHMKNEHRRQKERHRVRRVRIAIEKENDEVMGELLDAVGGTEEMLRGALKRLNDHKRVRDWVDKEFKKASTAAREAIAESTRKER